MKILVLAIDQNTTGYSSYWYSFEGEKLTAADVQITDDNLKTSYLTFRIQACLPLSFEHVDDPSKYILS